MIVLEYLLGIIVAGLIVKFIVLPAVRKSRGASGGSNQGRSPGDGTRNDQP